MMYLNQSVEQDYQLTEKSTMYSEKNYITTLLLSIYGFLGLHRFYVGKVGTGFLWLFTGGMFFVGWIADIVNIVTQKFADGKGRLIHKSMKPEKVVQQASSVPELKVTVTIGNKQEEREPVGELSHLDFGKPVGELGCFLNYEPRTLYPPSARQLNYLKDLGVFIPDGITNVDASCMISRAIGEDDKEGPPPSLVALALGLKTEFSAFVGTSGLLRSIIGQASDRDQAALYAYGVRQSMRGVSFGNMLEDPELTVFYAFAEQVLSDPALMRSLNGRTPDDFKNPYRGTAIYKAAASRLTGGSV